MGSTKQSRKLSFIKLYFINSSEEALKTSCCFHLVNGVCQRERTEPGSSQWYDVEGGQAATGLS